MIHHLIRWLRARRAMPTVGRDLTASAGWVRDSQGVPIRPAVEELARRWASSLGVTDAGPFAWQVPVRNRDGREVVVTVSVAAEMDLRREMAELERELQG